MDVEIEKPHVHHRTTHRTWFDFALPVAALFVSFVSIFIAWHHGQVMKELVRQNERLVQAESLPYLQIEFSNLAADRRSPAYRLTVLNQGVGPARIAETHVTVNGKAVPDFNTLVDRCCEAGAVQSAGTGAKQFRTVQNGDVVLTKLRDRMLRPGESVDAFEWPITPANRQLVSRLQQGFASDRITASVCYCSVFEDCWTLTDENPRPMPVKECPMAATPYRQ